MGKENKVAPNENCSRSSKNSYAFSFNLRNKPNPMEIQKYNLQQPKVVSLLTWIESGEISKPEIQCQRNTGNFSTREGL